MSTEKAQGVPILINRTRAGEEGLNRLLNVRIEKASLAGNIANPQTIHEAQNRAVEPKRAGQQFRAQSHPLGGSFERALAGHLR